jgi:energy-coupling factor transporter transmembrane protein EcfT
VRNAAGTVVPLLASSIRHADRVALAMESRAFGAHATRTERRPSLWRVRDTLFVTAVWSATAAILLGPVVLPG